MTRRRASAAASHQHQQQRGPDNRKSDRPEAAQAVREKDKHPTRVAPAGSPKTAFITIDGRRWRTSDPGIPENLRHELVNELMAARRAVRDGRTQLDIRRSRHRVNDAKLALGERGDAWWLPPKPAATNLRIDAAIRALLRSRQPGRSICPSDVARIVGAATWRTMLPVVRDRAVRMLERGDLEILRGGRVVKRNPTEGVLRYRLTARSRLVSNERRSST